MKKVFIRLSASVSVLDAVKHLESLGYKCKWISHHNPVGAVLVSGWDDGSVGHSDSVQWNVEEGFEEIFIPATKHKHYDLIVAWAADPSQKVWYNNGSRWFLSVIEPVWNPDYTYYIGEQPPKRKIMIGDVEIDAPEVVEPKNHDKYFLPHLLNLEHYSVSTWCGDSYDNVRLKRGLIHLNKEAAIAHAKALIKVGGGCVDE